MNKNTYLKYWWQGNFLDPSGSKSIQPQVRRKRWICKIGEHSSTLEKEKEKQKNVPPKPPSSYPKLSPSSSGILIPVLVLVTVLVTVPI